MKTTNIFLFLFSTLFAYQLFAQEKSSFVDSKTFTASPKELLISSTDKINEDAIFIIQKIKLTRFATPTITLENIQTQKITNTTLKNNSKIPTKFIPSVHLSMEKKQAIAYVLIPQYVQSVDGSIDKLLDYKLTIQENNNTANKTTGSRTYASNSILSSGNFYSIAIVNQGVYKIDYNFIKNNIGIDPSSINSANIRVYGNGGEMLSENNADFRNDDLVENAIQVVDGGDGKIDAGDYFLFYANGPNTIIKDSANKLFSHRYNIYNDVSYYFLNFDIGVGKRIALETTPTAANQTVTTFNDYQFHEKDSVNFGRFGKVWWGDEMNDLPGRVLSRTFSFSFPNIDLSTPITITSKTGSITHTAASQMSLTVNGNSFSNFYYGAFGYEFSDPTIRVINEQKNTTVTSPTINLTYDFNKTGAESAGFIDFIGINARRNLLFNGYINFADWNSVGAGNIANYVIQNTNSATKIIDITNPLVPTLMPTLLNGTTISFIQSADKLHRFIAFDESALQTPTFVSKLENQNLHHLTPSDYVIIVHPNYISEANRLAQYHATKRGYKTIIVSPQQIYNEFSSGSQDISAIRDFIKMLYDKSTNGVDAPSNVLLFGDASYDYKNRVANNTNYVPTYETNESISKTSGYCTDDFFGFLDDNENINDFSGTITNTLDVGIGRFTVNTLTSATDVVNKIINYDGPNSFGNWKNNTTFCADNGDGANHLDDAEIMATTINDSLPVYNINKVYVDGFVLQSTPAGLRCPDANTAIREQLYNGTFLMNYNGHGSSHSWCGERIFSSDDITSLKNYNTLPLFITATCDFAPFDNPADYSAGEILLSKSDGGAIALMTTTQLVYADQNRIMNQNYMFEGFKPLENGKNPTLGDAYRLSKNLRYITSVDEWVASNFRKFALLGDPGLPLAFPKYDIATDSVNGISTTIKIDTLKALNKYTISGHIADKQGNIQTNYNGVIYPTIYDKPKKLRTLQSIGDPLREYSLQNNAIFKGKSTVKNGKFSYTFVVPKDINYNIDKGKISYYSNSENEDGAGFNKNIFIGGSSTTAITDNVGPVIKAYMNDEKFVNGGIVTANSVLLLKLSDDNGINYSGNTIGHDITAVLDDNLQKTFVLNDFYVPNLDDYKSGNVKFPISNITEGNHTLTIKVWDIFNNSADVKISFEVVSSTKGQLSHVYNYPNPFTTKTQFMFEHNMPNQNLIVNISILSMTGKVVKQIHTVVNTAGTRVNNIDWDGLDQYGEKLGSGVYLYKLNVKSSSGFSDTKLEKLVILH